jgi:hypothetical protein
MMITEPAYTADVRPDHKETESQPHDAHGQQEPEHCGIAEQAAAAKILGMW